MEIKSCPHCGGVSEMTFKWPVFGWGGCEVKCLSCGAMVRNSKYSENGFDEERQVFYSHVTPKTIAACIESTIDAWNRRVVHEL